MQKKEIYRAIEIGIACGVCLYFIIKLVRFDNYEGLISSLCAMGWKQWSAVLACVLLMPVNMALEAWRWRTLLPMPWREAQRQIYYSKMAGLVTPWRLGEYPARAMMQGEWKETLSMGAVAGVTMTTAIVAAGLIALGIFGLEAGGVGDSYLYILGVVIVVLCLAMYFAPPVLKRYADVSHRLIVVSIGQSLVRLLCWCVQLGLVLYALGALGTAEPAEVLGKSAIYYLLVTVTPNVPIVEVGTRGAWAIVVFGTMNAALAGVLLWVINTLLPCLIWPFLRKNNKTLAYVAKKQ